MTLKSFLLGSAAAFAVVGGAEAADLSVAEPVEFVQICEAFGTGYWYIPGSDTCIKIGGEIEFDVNLHSLSATYPGAPSTHSSNWDFVTAASLNVTAKSMTEFGELVGYLKFKGSYLGTGAASTVLVDEAWLRIGALQAGHFGSPFNPGTGFVDYDVYNSNLADANKIQLSWAAAGFGLALGIEDPRETWGTDLPPTWSMPLITGAITASQSMWSGSLSAGFVQLNAGTAWGVAGQITFNLDTIAAGDKFKLQAIYGDNAFVGGPFLGAAGSNPATNNGWSALVSFQHMFSSTFKGDVDFSYLHSSGPGPLGGVNSWIAAADLVWSPAAGFSAKVRGDYTVAGTATGVWKGQIVLLRNW
jgi:hypothetical protein